MDCMKKWKNKCIVQDFLPSSKVVRFQVVVINFGTSMGYKEHTESSARNHRRQVPIPQADKNYKFWFFATQMRTLWLHVWQGREYAEDKYNQAQAR